MDPLDDATYCWHVHHDVLVEDVWKAYTSIRVRIKYIREEKLESEIPLRLHLLRPAVDLPDEFIQRDSYLTTDQLSNLQKRLIQLHAEQCDPQCPFEFTIVPPEYFEDMIIGNIFNNYNTELNRYTLKDGTVPEVKI